MAAKKSTFALFFGNRGFFPASLIDGARKELRRTLKEMGHKTLVINKKATRYGAVETVEEGEAYARFLEEKRGQYDGVIICLPNFGDETGAVAALQDAGVPILIQAYPDELDKMAPELRRDAFCGKLSIMDVFRQYGVKFTALKPHTVSPASDRFRANVEHFDSVCRVVKGLRRMTVGAVGARTTPFKTVRVDELALQRNGITMETIDLSSVFARMAELKPSDSKYRTKVRHLKKYAPWEGVPGEAFDKLVRLAVVLDRIVDEYNLDAKALRCWTELQEQHGISPCVVMGEMGSRGIPCACEVDAANAVTMRALALASGKEATCLDWNNNYGDDDDMCILFHCGPVPAGLMASEGCIVDHSILANAVGEGKGYGCHVGRIAPCDFTFGSMTTDAGRLKFYLGEGRFTEDEIPDDFFGCAGVAEIERLQDVLLHVGYEGHRHHVSVTPNRVAAPLREAFERYLGFEVTQPQLG